MKCDEIFAALAMLEKERGIPQDFMMNKIVQALTTAYKRDHEGVENVVVEVNEEKRDLKMFVQKEIVEEVENPGSQISLEEARRISAKYELGGMVRFPVENVEFGRIAAGNGKQVIIQGLREAEHGMIYDEWGSKQHEILTGTVSRIDPRSGSGACLLAAILVLTVMVLPSIINVAETALQAVPREYEEASLALGATETETYFRVSLPAARSGVAAAVVLGVGRAIGEAMAIIMVAGNVANMPGLFTSVRFLTTGIISGMSDAAVGSLYQQALFSIGLVLFLFIMLINVLLNVCIKRKKED